VNKSMQSNTFFFY